MAQNPPQRFCVTGNDGVEPASGKPVEPALFGFGLVPEKLRAHHRRQCQRNNRGNENRETQRNGELAEESPHHIAHEEQWNQYGDQRNRER